MYWGISPSFGGFHEHSLNCEPNGNSKLDAVKYRGLVSPVAAAIHASGHFYFAQTGNSHFAATQVETTCRDYVDSRRARAYHSWQSVNGKDNFPHVKASFVPRLSYRL